MNVPDLPPFARRYERPNLNDVRARSTEFTTEIAATSDATRLLDLAVEWNALRTTLDTARQIANVLYHQDTSDSWRVGEDEFWNDAAPTLREIDAGYARALLGHPQRAVLDRAFGSQFLSLLSCVAESFHPKIAEGIREEAQLVSTYTRALSEAGAEFRGERLTLAQLGRSFSDSDRNTRLEAQQSRDRFLHERSEHFDGLYDRLVHLRDGMARSLGHSSFTPLGYRLMHRTAYGAPDVAKFRSEILREVVPVATEVATRQARRIGIDRLSFHDEPVTDIRGNPQPLGDADYCLKQAHQMFREFGASSGEMMDTMVREGMFDLVARTNKAAGGFCTMFWDDGRPFVFANFTGTDADVTTLIHECGHAFAAWCMRKAPLLEYRFATFEACEVHSMGMEYLASPWIGLFFGEAEAPRVRRSHLESRVTALPYMAAIDEFQHRVYSSPSLSPAERRSLWCQIERTYLPYRSYDPSLTYVGTGGIWQRQLHVYVSPFYYIDYALAQTCALQLWHRARRYRDGAERAYLTLCNSAGDVPFEEMVRRAGLRSPFEEGCLREIVSEVRQVLSSESGA